MNRYLWVLLLPLAVFANQIKLEHAEIKPLGKIIQTNAEIIQLSNQKQKIVSRLLGHVEAYYVKMGEYVKKGDRVVLIESIELSKMSAEYLALSQQLKAAKNQLSSLKKLYKKGLTSQNELNAKIIALEQIHSKQNTLTSQLKSLGINPTELTEATDKFILYAHADGIVGKILVPLHDNVNAQTAIMTLVNQNAYYAVAYLSIDDAMKITDKTTGWLTILAKKYTCRFVQLLPHIDKETQRAKVLFQIENSPKNLLLGAYTPMEISLEPYDNVLMIKKSALTLFKGEWVVFVENHHEEHKEDEVEHHHNEHEEENHNKNDTHDTHDTHDEHDEEPSPYTPKVVHIIAYFGDYVAIEGLHKGDEYVSQGVYFVKSILLRSSLGGHGH